MSTQSDKTINQFSSNRNTILTTLMFIHAGAVLRWGWFQQQKYAFLKSRLFLYSGEINTRIS